MYPYLLTYCNKNVFLWFTWKKVTNKAENYVLMSCFFFKELLLKISLLCLKYKLFSCLCPGPGLLNSKLEFSIQKAQRTQQPMSISLSKFASLSLLCGKWKWMYFTYVHIWIHQNHNLMVNVNIAPNWVQNVTYKITIFLFIFHLEHLWNSIVKVSTYVDQGICCNKSKVGSKWKSKYYSKNMVI